MNTKRKAQIKHYIRNPWCLTLIRIKTRCSTIAKYGKIGIKNFLDKEDLKVMWYRDNAFNMKKPSIHRIDNNKDYTFDNCKYIELTENKKLAKNKVRVFQYSIDGVFIKQYPSMAQASRDTGICESSIRSVVVNRTKTAGGYKWIGLKKGE